jgi:hypothetical protein
MYFKREGELSLFYHHTMKAYGRNRGKLPSVHDRIHGRPQGDENETLRAISILFRRNTTNFNSSSIISWSLA